MGLGLSIGILLVKPFLDHLFISDRNQKDSTFLTRLSSVSFSNLDDSASSAKVE